MLAMSLVASLGVGTGTMDSLSHLSGLDFSEKRRGAKVSKSRKEENRKKNKEAQRKAKRR
jgi:hypothetical protein